MKAIETIYHGYRFRSRLEARWAVFFDALGFGWTYEPEGYELPSGLRYLPDFSFQDWNLICEVKPKEPLSIEFRKARELASASGQNVLMLCGAPGLPNIHMIDPEYAHIKNYEYEAIMFVGNYETADKLVRQDDFFGECHRLESLSAFLKDRVAEGLLSGDVPDFDGKHETVETLIALDRTYYQNRHGRDHPRWGTEGLVMRPLLWCETPSGHVLSDATVCLYEDQKTPALVAGYEKARQARFEFDEAWVW